MKASLNEELGLCPNVIDTNDAVIFAVYIPKNKLGKYNYFLQKLGIIKYSQDINNIHVLIDEIEKLSVEKDNKQDGYLRKLQLIYDALNLIGETHNLSNKKDAANTLFGYSKSFDKWLETIVENTEIQAAKCLNEIVETIEKLANDLRHVNIDKGVSTLLRGNLINICYDIVEPDDCK